jgi:hypothetical protein
MRMRHRIATLVGALGLLTAVLPASPAVAGTPAAGAGTSAAAAGRAGRLTNLAHLDSLTATVTPPAQPGHTTYHLAAEPGIGTLWVYADHQPDGSYHRTGGGSYDAAANTYGQGAYDADDIARAAVVYLRYWRATGDGAARDHAYRLLRGLTYLQTATGPHAGEVVLWMQPDGTLNPSPTPKDSPDPSDSGASYWLARTLWALGEGYADFAHADPSFAAFLRDRFDLAVTALDRDTLGSYGTYRTIDGVRMPAWLISDGADASSEALLGLAAYADAAPDSASRRAALRAASQLATGVAAMGAGSARQWPYGAVLPWALSRADWHAWGAQMPSGLARAATALHQPALLRPAVADAAVFTPTLLTATGPDNGWLPTPADGSQIAYGADARVQSLLAVARAAGRPGLRRLAGFAAGWFFGQNPSGQAMYDPATGVTFDGVSAGGQLNLNSGAESTIHGLLTMEALDAAPDVAALARAAGHVVSRDGQQVVEAESATLTGDASVTTPASAWTGEAQWSGGAYVSAGTGSTLTWQLPAAGQPRLVQPVADLDPSATATTRFTSGATELGKLDYGAVGPQGGSSAPGVLLPTTLPRELPASATTLTATTAGGTGRLDALLIQPLISRLVTGHAALLHSAATASRTATVTLPGTGRARYASYDVNGRPAATGSTTDATLHVPVPPGGFALVVR